MAEEKKARRPRREFTDEFKASAVRLVIDGGKTVKGTARDLDLNTSTLQLWVTQARANQSNGKTGLTSDERAELTRLRKENRELKMTQEILKKAAAFFAKDSQ
jgi:transposase